MNVTLCIYIIRITVSFVFQSNQRTAGDLAKESGSQSCSEYLQYVQDHGINPDSRTQDSSSSNDDVSSSSCSEDEKDEQESKEKDNKDFDISKDKIEDTLDNHRESKESSFDNEKNKDEGSKREDSFDNEKDGYKDCGRAAMIRSPNMNNNNSPYMSSVEDEKAGTEDEGASAANNTSDAERDRTTTNQDETSKRQKSRRTNSRQDKKDTRPVSSHDGKGKADEERKDGEERGASDSSSWDPDKLQKKIANWDEYIKGKRIHPRFF